MSTWIHHRIGKHRRNQRASSASMGTPGRSVSLESQARQIRLRLQDSGPAHSCLGLYLSSRIDLLPAEYCRELALIQDSALPIARDVVERLLEQELGSQARNAFAEFDYEPEQSTLISQRHTALLRTGTPVSVILLRPALHEIQNGLLDTNEISELFDGLLTPQVFADFTEFLRRKTNFALAREGMELMARDPASFELLKSHKTFPELSTSRVLTLELVNEQPLGAILQSPSRALDVLASRICQVWLQQALHGHSFPVDPQLQNIYLGEDNQIAFLNCDLIGLASSAKENLSNYFDALLADDPDKAARYLFREMVPLHRDRKIDVDGLRSSFRQAAYFGALEPILGTDCNSLAQMAFQHWKTAIEHGFSPKTHLLCFYRGLFSIARAARQLSGTGDPVREALEELHTTTAFNQLREIMDWRYWFQNSDKFGAAMINLPRAFDDALTKASTGVDAVPPGNFGNARSPRKNSVASLLVLLVLIAVTAQLPDAQGWSGKMIPVALMLAGLLMLRESG